MRRRLDGPRGCAPPGLFLTVESRAETRARKPVRATAYEVAALAAPALARNSPSTRRSYPERFRCPERRSVASRPPLGYHWPCCTQRRLRQVALRHQAYRQEAPARAPYRLVRATL